MKKIIASSALAFALAVSARAATVFSENFGTLANGTTLTTTNTAFNYVRASTGATPTLQATNPGSFTGASGSLGATNTSITALGAVSGTYGAFDVGTLSFSLATPADISGTFFISGGTGTSFTNAVAFSTNDLTFGIQLVNGVLQTRTGGTFVTFGSGLAASTAYNIEIDFNNSASTASFAGGSAATKTADFYVNGALVGNDIGIQGAQSLTGFRFYTISDPAGNAFQLDNVVLASVPEPSTYVMLIAGVGAMALVYRRKAGMKA